MYKHLLMIVGVGLLIFTAYAAGSHRANVAYAQSQVNGTVPKSYGRIVTAIADSIGTGLVFEDSQGTIRFVSVTGMKEGELARYDKTPVHGGIPRSYGHLVAAVTRDHSTGLIFEDAQGVIRFVTISGVVEGELDRK